MNPDLVVAAASDAIEYTSYKSNRSQTAMPVARGKSGKIEAVIKTQHGAIPPEIARPIVISNRTPLCTRFRIGCATLQAREVEGMLWLTNCGQMKAPHSRRRRGPA